LIAAGFCYIRTGLNEQKKRINKIICLSKLQSFWRIREIAESADSYVMPVRLSVRQYGKLERLSSNFLLAVIIKICRKSSIVVTTTIELCYSVIRQFTERPKHDVLSA
jgi:E3 ubiquitin-protein ligase DOA10